MKKLVIATLLSAACLVLTGVTTELQAGDIEKVLYERTFDVNKNPSLNINHSFGNLTLKNWEKNEVSIKITASAETSNEEKAEELFNYVVWDVNGNKSEVNASCKLSKKSNGNKHGQLNFEMEVFAPKTMVLNLKHQFGNAYVEDIEGDASISSEYGSINIGTVSGSESKLRVSFGSGKIDNFGGGSIEVNYSSLDLGEAGDTRMQIDYSEVKADRIEKINLSLEGGGLILGSTNSIYGKSKFSNLEIDELSQSLDVVTGYGNFHVRNISKDFSEISVKNSYGSTKLYIDESATYTIEAETVHCSMGYPDYMADFTHKEKSISTSYYKGVIGKGSSPTGKVYIESKYGGTDLYAN
jgi:hypothetical protein